MSSAPTTSPNSGNVISHHLGSEEKNEEGRTEIVEAGETVRWECNHGMENGLDEQDGPTWRR